MEESNAFLNTISLEKAAAGMAVVFAFLLLMIVCINLAAKLIRKMGWDKDIEQPKYQSQKPSGIITPEITAAISAAFTEHKRGVIPDEKI